MAIAAALDPRRLRSPIGDPGYRTRRDASIMSDKMEESRSRLESLLPRLGKAAERLARDGGESVRALGLRSPVLDAETLTRALDAGPGKLESVGVNPMALEAIIRLTGRPPLIVRNDAVVIEPPLLEEFPITITGQIKAVEPALASVGRIEFVNHEMAWGGTGWVVDSGADSALVVTNRHVAKLVAKRSADGRGVFLRSPYSGARYGASIDFNEEVDARVTDARNASATAVEYLADDTGADVALLRIKRPLNAAWAWPDSVPLADQEAGLEELVALIGYPAYDTRNDVTAMERYFRGLYDVKRFAPGRVTRAADSGGVISHDCTSLGGNSGSVLLSLERRVAVGLHFAGQYGIANSAVSAATLRRLVFGSRTTVAGAVLQETFVEAKDGLHTADDLKDREGYVPGFLGKTTPPVPWPTLAPEIAAGLAKPVDALPGRPHELRYTHFGVLFSQDLKLPAATAVNIDGKQPVRIKRGDDKWFVDARIDPACQYTAKHYGDQAIDRGHMVRREDPNWGDDAIQANFDTFHYTNAAPQHALLNQGKSLWQGLENYILDNSRTEGFKACVFTGPILNGDYEYLPEEGDVRVPLEFWKVAVMTAKTEDGQDTLHATAYVLSQGHLIRKLLEDRQRSEALEGFRLGAYRTFQVAIRDLEAATGMNFHDLRNYDPLAATKAGSEAIAQDEPVFVPLETAADLVL
ncbi:nuclease, putative [Caulobacter vibrioides CB15]|uniref:Nuclease, putative n=3 Tax=Caulobacter vibrioides TaxID=155892 RepID=Q9AAQ2_CAUVC|nr:nuclease, putative [Caulobacter vibrioides CB15]ATC27391.1 nuclease [Caulobacter vibrioides]